MIIPNIWKVIIRPCSNPPTRYMPFMNYKKLVKWDYKFPNLWKVIIRPCSKPPTRLYTIIPYKTMENHNLLMGKSPFLMYIFSVWFQRVFPCEFIPWGCERTPPSPPGTAHRSSWQRHDVPRDELPGTGPGLRTEYLEKTSVYHWLPILCINY